MTSEPLPPLTAAARRRSQRTREHALQALHELSRAGTPVTFTAVARHANVSRSWLYRQPDVRSEIARLSQSRTATGRPTRPDIERSSPHSQQQRIANLLETNKELRQENDRLRHQIARTLGQQRDTATPPAEPE